jgi:hypothetical protein
MGIKGNSLDLGAPQIDAYTHAHFASRIWQLALNVTAISDILI